MTQRTNRITQRTTPMELQNVLSRTDMEHLDLSFTERLILSALIGFVNGKQAESEGLYEATPAVETLCKRTGYGTRAVDGSKKKLQEKGWIKIIAGNGRGNSNHYYIDVRRIIVAYNASGMYAHMPVPEGNAFEAIEAKPSTHVRNAGNLMQGKHSPNASQKASPHTKATPATPKAKPTVSSPPWDIDDDEDDYGPPCSTPKQPKRSGTISGSSDFLRLREEDNEGIEEDDELGVPF